MYYIQVYVFFSRFVSCQATFTHPKTNNLCFYIQYPFPHPVLQVYKTILRFIKMQAF